MQVKWRAVYFISGLIMFFTMSLLGLAAQVSWNIVLLRAFGATLALEGIILALDIYINNFLLPYSEDLGEDSLSELWQINDGLPQGSLLNITLPEETFQLEESGEEAAADFKPFAPQQINPDVEKIIKDDPQRAAEIIRKMGLE
ncbi:MAG: hypothetical protein M0Z31_03250 [Clostridia bacterium]|nr:hypothetical protein [Clostridia bacterium]